MYFQVDNNKKEETKHVTNRLPIAIYHRFLIKERHDEITLHWHEELQFISVFFRHVAIQCRRQRIST